MIFIFSDIEEITQGLDSEYFDLNPPSIFDSLVVGYIFNTIEVPDTEDPVINIYLEWIWEDPERI